TGEGADAFVGVGGVRGDHHILQVPQWVAVREGFRVGDVQGGAGDGAIPDGVDQVVGDHEGTTADVDHHGVGFHLRQGVTVDDAGGGLGQGHEQDEVVGLGPDVVGGGHGEGFVGTRDRAAGIVHGDD